jgi:uncharacterized protein YndB with AHSA1/START domain
MTDQPQRTIDLSVQVPGCPEEVWAAVATGPGISSWFVPTVVAEHEGGPVTMDFGSFGTQTAKVTAWEPPRRVVFSSDQPPLAYEWLVEATDADGCVVRLRNSGYGTDAGSDADVDGMTEGWRLFLANLRLHLTHFRGLRARALVPVGTLPGPNAAAFATLCRTLGVPDDLRPGDPLTTSGAGVPRLTGTVVEAHRKPKVSNYLLLLDEPAPGTGFLAAEGDGDAVAVSLYHYLYVEGDQAPADPWTLLFADRFAPPAAAAEA